MHRAGIPNSLFTIHHSAAGGLHRAGTIFTRYFSDKKYGGECKALQAATAALNELKGMLENSRLVNGKLSKSTTIKGRKLLKGA